MRQLPLSFSHYYFDVWHDNTWWFRGLLFEMPASSMTKDSEAHFRSVAYQMVEGWSLAPDGTAMYCFLMSPHEVIVVPGLLIPGFSASKHIATQNESITNKESVEEHVKLALAAHEAATAALHEELRGYVHEIKKINSVIYNMSLDLHFKLSRTDTFKEYSSELYTIIENANLLRMRSDLMQFVANPDFVTPDRDISVFESFNRIARMFKSVNPLLDISVINESDFRVYGPDFFDLIPFIAVENAVKYCPKGCRIQVSIQDRGNERIVKIFTVGPKIDDDERSKIFMGYRGRNAVATSKEGEGIGLPTLKRIIVEHFAGDIIITQRDMVANINMVPYHEIVYRIVLPDIKEHLEF